MVVVVAVAAILPGPEVLLSVGRSGDNGACCLGEEGYTCTYWVVENWSLVVRRVGRGEVLGVGRVECWAMEREGEAMLDNYRVVRVGREALRAVGCEGWLT